MPIEWFERSQEHGLRIAQGSARQIEAMVHSVREVDITNTRIGEHRAIAFGHSTLVGVRRRIVRPDISLGFNDSTAKRSTSEPPNERLSEESPGKRFRITSEERPLGTRAHHLLHSIRGCSLFLMICPIGSEEPSMRIARTPSGAASVRKRNRSAGIPSVRATLTVAMARSVCGETESLA